MTKLFFRKVKGKKSQLLLRTHSTFLCTSKISNNQSAVKKVKSNKFDWLNQTITSEIARGVINANLFEADKLNSNQNLAFSNIKSMKI